MVFSCSKWVDNRKIDHPHTHSPGFSRQWFSFSWACSCSMELVRGWIYLHKSDRPWGTFEEDEIPRPWLDRQNEMRKAFCCRAWRTYVRWITYANSGSLGWADYGSEAESELANIIHHLWKIGFASLRYQEAYHLLHTDNGVGVYLNGYMDRTYISYLSDFDVKL
jgi:hypothetical protein